MYLVKTLGVLALSSLVLTGCLSGGGGGGNDSADGGGGDGGGGMQPTTFTALVQDIFAQTSDSAEPVDINALDITYDDQDNEDAFNDLLSQQ